MKLPKIAPASPAWAAHAFPKMAKVAERPPRTDEPSSLPMDNIMQELALFQPRFEGIAYAPGRSEAHIAKLARTPRSGSPLDPLTVVAMGDIWYLVDGHHRIKAYEEANWTKPVLVQVASSLLLGAERVEWAIGLSLADNGKDRLGLVDADKQTKAWQAVARSASGSQAELARRHNVSPRTIAYMRAAKKRLEEEGLNLDHFPTWRRAQYGVKALDAQEGDAEQGDWDEKKRRDLANRLKPVMDLRATASQLLEALEGYDPYVLDMLIAARDARKELEDVDI